MAKIVVRIEIPGTRDGLQKEIDADRHPRESWFSRVDGADKILIDEAYLVRARADDSFFAFEFVGVED